MVIDVHCFLPPQPASPIPASDVENYCQITGVDVFLVANPAAAAVGNGEPDETAANAACLAVCSGHERLVPLYWACPGRPDSHVQAFAGALQTEPFAGAVFAPFTPGGDPQAACAALEGHLAVLSRLRRPAVFILGDEGPGALDGVLSLARRYDGAPIVLCGLCHGGRQRVWVAALDELTRAARRSDAQIFIDTSFTRPEDVVNAARTYGASRLIHGTGATLFDGAAAQRSRIDLAQLRRSLGTDVFGEIYAGHAQRLLAVE
ncbi:MAG: hypothetical protein PVJ57_11245 [Phycisphaerae bacterium]|jgi:hypothetical protein